jgi:hypothetical protein
MGKFLPLGGPTRALILHPHCVHVLRSFTKIPNTFDDFSRTLEHFEVLVV